MPSLIQPRIGAGRFQWNARGWFGSVIGSTTWMLVAAGFLIAYRQWLALVPIGCFVIINSIAWVLWRRRDRLDPFSSLMMILASIAVAVPIALATSVWRMPEMPWQMNWTDSPVGYVVAVLLVPTMIAWFYIIERRTNRSLTCNDDSNVDAT